ncbi:MAG: helicase-related protein [Candidatus Poribacteria bacterium]|nr:helicase-related protein [Candidatus Poribacteria bacterium]
MSTILPADYPQKIRDLRETKGLTQTQFAELVGVSFATVNRWENAQSRPNNLAWKRIVELAASSDGGQAAQPLPDDAPSMDFAADPNAVSAVAEAHRLAYGHLFNPAFATETSLIDPLPHQRIAVYEKMLGQNPLRFLLADDAGAGKTIMTGLYIREMLSRRLIRRVLIIPPAGLVGNWVQEMRKLFRLSFRIIRGDDARDGNPFSGAESDQVIVSVDTLVTARVFDRLRDPRTDPYDLAVFDEAHKLSANRRPDLRVRKTNRYRLAEAIAGVEVDSDDWKLPQPAQHLLLLTATPHMGKDFPYYFLWRLLLPEVLSTYDAFDRFPRELRDRHFIRRTKEEMLHYNEKPLYPQRNCDTLSYNLSDGPEGEQELYDETTEYIRDYYNRAKELNRSAAQLAMSVFQRRLASSTYALMRSFERRRQKLEGMIDDIMSGRVNEKQFASQQQRLDVPNDVFDASTADETEDDQNEAHENQALGGTTAFSLTELMVEKGKVEELLDKSRKLLDAGEESKFEKLREVLRHPKYNDEKFIIFTEHRDTAEFLVRRLEGLGFTDQVALIHGGLDYREREEQVEFFRRSAEKGGANYLVATDAAGEGINLQFCWLMVNYDIPWNPARLEQRMGRIHRYGQKHDPVVIVNLVAGGTREGRVLKTLLDKLEIIREQLQSDKVFDVVGRLFESVSMTDYLRQTLTDDVEEVAAWLEGNLTEDQVRALERKEQVLYGGGGDVRRRLPQLNEETEQEIYRHLLPGYVRRFVERAAPLLDLRIEGDADTAFSLIPNRPRASDSLLTSLERYSEGARQLLTVYKPVSREDAVWMHPGEPVFDCLSDAILERFGRAGRQGAVYTDPYAAEAYLFHIALVSVEQRGREDEMTDLFDDRSERENERKPLESRLVGLRQSSDGSVTELPVEHLLLLRGAGGFAPSRVPLATLARGMVPDALEFAREEISERLAQHHRQRRFDDLPSRMESVNRGFDFQAAELAAARSRLNQLAREGDRDAEKELGVVRERQRGLTAARNRRMAELRAEPELIQSGDAVILVHALVVPVQDTEAVERYDAGVEAVAVEVATAYEEHQGAVVTDVSKPELARRAGLMDWPGFDLKSRRPAGADGSVEERAIEVKGRAGSGDVQMSENEWARACNLREDYWLYVVFDCATPRPRLVRVQDPFAKLLVRSRESLAFTITEGALNEASAPVEETMR